MEPRDGYVTTHTLDRGPAAIASGRDLATTGYIERIGELTPHMSPAATRSPRARKARRSGSANSGTMPGSMSGILARPGAVAPAWSGSKP